MLGFLNATEPPADPMDAFIIKWPPISTTQSDNMPAGGQTNTPASEVERQQVRWSTINLR